MNDKERIESAIRHIKTSVDIDPWAMEIAVEAMEKQIPMRIRLTTSTKRCSSCKKQLTAKGCIHETYRFCKWCGQAIDWSEDER